MLCQIEKNQQQWHGNTEKQEKIYIDVEIQGNRDHQQDVHHQQKNIIQQYIHM
jgi:hypothetical protein